MKNRWIPYVKNNGQARMRLFCLPYAGGGASVYWSWRDHIIPEVELCPVQMPGREGRITEAPLSQIDEIVDRVFENIRSNLDLPYVLFGHSMGATVAFELAQRSRQAGERQPLHLFVSGTDAPQLPEREPLIYDLPDADFLRELHAVNGGPNPALQNPELVQLLLPALRADFVAIQTYQYRERAPLTCAITAFGGFDDPYVSAEGLELWREQTVSEFESRQLPGDHFFLHSARPELLQEINYRLRARVRDLQSAGTKSHTAVSSSLSSNSIQR